MGADPSARTDRDHATRLTGMGCALFKEGRFDLAWRYYESRFVSQGRVRDLPQPLWRGEPLAARHLLVHREQGVGDEIMYASCFPELLGQCGHLTVTCDERLLPLYERSFPGATIVPGPPMKGSDWKRCAAMPADFQIAAGSVPLHLRSHVTSFPPHRGYLRADDGQRARWRRRLAEASGDGLRIGISWQGGGDLESLRRAPWAFWQRLFECRGDAVFVNLQYGDNSRVLADLEAQLGVRVLDFPDLDTMNDLDGVAALLGELDAVVSVPNTVVHLASSLGLPVWFVFARPWGCSWILNDATCVWYPSLTVFRFEEKGGWLSLADSIVRAMAQLGARIGRGRDAGVSARTSSA